MKKWLLLTFAVLFLVSCSVNVSEKNDINETFETQEDIIVPYIAKSKTYYSEYGRKSVVNSYGFCNLDGNVVIEPRSDISVLNCHMTNDGFSFYEVGIGQSEQSTYANGFDPMKTLIIPANGEWCVELDEVGWWTITAGDGAIFASLDSTRENWIIEAKTLIYDYNGNLIKEFGPSSYVSGYSETYKDCVKISSFADHPNETETIYVNSKGDIIEEPKKNGHGFNEYGVKISTDEYGFILENDKGHMLTETSFEKLEYFSKDDGTNGLFVAKMQVTNDLYQYFFFSADGRSFSSESEVYSKYDVELFFPDSGDIICKYLADDGVFDDVNVFINLSESKIIHEDHSGRFFFNKSNDNVIVADGRTYGGGFGMIFDYYGNELLRIDDFYSFNDVSENGRFLTYTSCANYYDLWDEDYSVEKDERKTFIYDIQEGKALHSFHGLSYTDFIGNNDRFVYMYNRDDIEGGNTYNYCLYDTEKRKLLVEDAEDIQHFSADGKDYFAVSYKDSSALYDENFNIIKKEYFE